MCDDIRRTLKVAKIHNTNLATVKLSAHFCSELPAWYHLNNKPGTIKGQAAKCLLEKHSMKTVTNLVKMSAHIRTQHNTDPYRPFSYCRCQDCVEDREKGCYHPHECTTEALACLNKISPRLNPLGPQNPWDLLSLMLRCKATNLQAKQTNGAITFDPSLTCNDSLSECFQVFINLKHLLTSPVLCHQ
jgi:hypothetical protein